MYKHLIKIPVFNLSIPTPLEVTRSAIPSGINAIPMAKKAGKTVPAVKIGCHAGNFCCLNFVSRNRNWAFILFLY